MLRTRLRWARRRVRASLRHIPRWVWTVGLTTALTARCAYAVQDHWKLVVGVYLLGIEVGAIVAFSLARTHYTKPLPPPRGAPPSDLVEDLLTRRGVRPTRFPFTR